MVIWTNGRLKELYNLITYSITQNQDSFANKYCICSWRTYNYLDWYRYREFAALWKLM